jgi:uncharacterized protein YggE
VIAMNRLLSLLRQCGAVLLVPAVSAFAAGQPVPQDADVIVTAGQGVIKAAPDRAFVTIAAESRAKTPAEAQGQNARAMTAVQDRLKAAGLPADAIRTISYDLQPEYDYAGGKQSLRGYLARNSIEVRVDRIERIGEVIDASVTSGATSVSDIRFDLKDRDAVEREALKQAVADARSRADALASAAGRAIERIVRIEDAGSMTQPPPRPMMMMRGAEAAAASPPPPVVAGQLEVMARVTLTARVR